MNEEMDQPLFLVLMLLILILPSNQLYSTDKTDGVWPAFGPDNVSMLMDELPRDHASEARDEADMAKLNSKIWKWESYKEPGYKVSVGSFLRSTTTLKPQENKQTLEKLRTRGRRDVELR